MIQSPQYTAPQQAQYYQRPPVSYNAVQINMDTPTVNAPGNPYYYDYPQAPTQPYYPPAQPGYPPQTPGPAVMVPPPVVEQTPVQPQPVQPQPVQPQPVQPQPVQPQGPAPVTPVANEVDTAAVVANLSNLDYDVAAAQMEEIAKKGLTNEADAIPYVQEDIFTKLIDIVGADSSKLPGPTEEQLKLRDKYIENEMTRQAAVQQGADPNSVKVPHSLTPEEVALATTITPFEKAERNKEYALFTMAILQKTYTDEIEKSTGNVVPLTDLPGVATVVEELKTNKNPAIRTASIDALRYIQRPEYKNDLATIYSIAQSDADNGVVVAAQDALKSLG